MLSFAAINRSSSSPRATDPVSTFDSRDLHDGLMGSGPLACLLLIVDLLMAYSERPDLLFDLVSAVEQLRVKDAQKPEEASSVRSEGLKVARGSPTGRSPAR